MKSTHTPDLPRRRYLGDPLDCSSDLSSLLLATLNYDCRLQLDVPRWRCSRLLHSGRALSILAIRPDPAAFRLHCDGMRTLSASSIPIAFFIHVFNDTIVSGYFVCDADANQSASDGDQVIGCFALLYHAR